MRTAGRPHVGIIIKTAVTVSIFYILFSRLDTRLILKIASRSNLWLLFVSFFIFLSRNIFGALRNKVLLAYKSFTFPVLTLTRLYFIGFFFNMFLPTVVGGDIARGFYLYKYSGGKEETVSSILVERALGILAMMFLSVIAVLLAMVLGVDVIANDVIKVIFTAFGVGFLLSLLFFYEKTERLVERCIPQIAIRKFGSIVTVIRNVINYNRAPVVLVNAFLLSVVFQFLSIVSTYLISVSLGGSTSFVYFLILLPVIWLISMIPVSINGLGLREGAFVFLFSTAGMSKELAMTVSILWLAQTVALGIIGGFIFLSEGGTISTIRQYRKA